MKYCIIIVICAITLLATTLNTIAQPNYTNNYSEETGVVLNIITEKTNESGFNRNEKTQIATVKVLSGEHKDKEFTVNNVLSGNPAYDIIIKPNDKVILDIEEDNTGNPTVNISNKLRTHALLWLFIGTLFFIIVFGRLKGVKALISLSITYSILFYFLIPYILKGYSPLILTIICCIIISLLTTFINSGLNFKSLSAVIGTAGGVITAGIAAMLTIYFASLSGLPDEEAIALWTGHPNLDFKGLLSSAMIIGSLGAAMDVSISVASSINEVKTAHPEAGTSYLTKSGLKVGRDIMGANMSTLLLAYTGSSLFLLLLVYENVSPVKFFNLESIISEIIAALAGTMGLIFCIPFTAFISGHLLNINQQKIETLKSHDNPE